MIDPFALFLVYFGGALLGLVAGLTRKNGAIDTIVYIIVAEIFGLGVYALFAVFFGNFTCAPRPEFNDQFDLPLEACLAIIYPVPLIGGLIGVAVVGLVSRSIFRQRPTQSSHSRVHRIINYVTCLLLGLAILLLLGNIITVARQDSPNWYLVVQWAVFLLPFVLMVLSSYTAIALVRKI